MAIKKVAMRKAVFFTIDSLLASGVIILMILLISEFYSNKEPSINVNYASQDLIRVFSTMRVEEVQNDYVKSLVAAGEITNINNTILEQIGDFWAQDKIDLAKNFTQNLTEEIFPAPFGFSVLVNEEAVYSRNLPIKKSLVSSKKIISGIAKAKPTEGFTARALLSGIKSKKTSAYVYFGGYEGDGNLTKKLILPNDVVSFNSSYFEADIGGNFNLYINGFYSGYYEKDSAGGGELLADKWNLSGNNLSFFKSGENTITINFTKNNSYIAGGFLRVTYVTSSYNGTQTPGHEKVLLPGIDGIINLYSSVYFPSFLGNMSAYIHFLSNSPLYMTIGNSTIFETEGSSSEQSISLNSSAILSLLKNSSLSFDFLSGKTVPYRLGLVSGNLEVGGADAVLITDRTIDSMSKCDVLADCTESNLCDSNPVNGCHKRRIDVAADSDRRFINTTLATPGSNNQVALAGFGTQTNPACDIHEFTADKNSLVNRTYYYRVSSASCGYTCLSCGIYSATQLLAENGVLYGFERTTLEDNTIYSLNNNFNNITFYLNASVNPNKLLKARLSTFSYGAQTAQGNHDCVYFNNHYVGRLCDLRNWNYDYNTCSYAIKPEWFNLNDISKNNVTITAGTTNACFASSILTHDSYQLAGLSFVAWEADSAPNVLYNSTYDTAQFANGIELNRTNVTIEININISDAVYLSEGKTKIKSALLEFDAANGTPNFYNCVYVNGNYIGRIDYQEWNRTSNNFWQKVLFDVPAVFLRNGTNKINLTSGTDTQCYGMTLNNHVAWRFRNLSLTTYWTDSIPNYNRHKSLLVMSDGFATTMIENTLASPYADAQQEAIDKACEAHNLYNISIYAILMGSGVAGNAAEKAAIETVNRTACCDNCSHFYIGSNLSEILKAYTAIAQNISGIVFEEGSQTALPGAAFGRTHLFPDSYFEFNYTYDPVIYFNKIPMSFETERFGNSISSGALSIFPNTTFGGGKVTSYSGSKWTDTMLVNKSVYFNLSDYGNYSDDALLTKTYRHLGDPFIVDIPQHAITERYYNITVSTGINSTNPTNGSQDNRIIYSLLLKAASDYSSVVAKSDGCSWTVIFQDGTSSTIKVPADYSGSDACDFLSKVYDQNDALDNSVYELFMYLDFDKDGKLDISIDQSDLSFNTLTLSKVPSLWGPAIVEIRVWN